MARERVAIQPRASDPTLRAAIVDRARRRGFRRFVVPEGTPFVAEDGDELTVRGTDGLRVGSDPSPVPVRPIADAEELERAVAATPTGGLLVIEWSGDRVIPLENAIAQRGRRFALWAYARSPAEVPAALGALEHGADRVVVEIRGPEEIDMLEALVEGALPAGLEWRSVPARRVHPAGIGDRVLVDTTSLLRPSEGLLVGSAAAFLFHVASEAVGSRFSRPRPFRVNAGAAHSYVLMADGATRYLAELEAGDAVLAVEPNGTARAVRVGRIKIERRPLVVVEADDDGVGRTVFLQEAETVRLSTASGRVATAELRAGAALWGVRLPPARHLGQTVHETIEER
ncbi:MAG TPA: 3-dehydroquinate synthase II [Thermoplasmata archaeon]|nr:3-dehydroquinate synthase II [Thermoplasmata archaeon]HTW56391.1 3-dehydroquinate synthase II [Thermoplasmata archaeon]